MKVLPSIDKALRDRHRAKYEVKILAELQQLLDAQPKNAKAVRNYLNVIIAAVPGDGGLLTGDATRIKPILRSVFRWAVQGSMQGINAKLRDIFDYDAFARCQKGWGGAEFMRSFEKIARYCPYCNADLVYAVETDNRGTHFMRTAFDHFYPRGKYPFLGLSLYNLIPSCERCNAKFKHAKDPYVRNVAHPYIDDVDARMMFVPIFKDLSFTHNREFESLKKIRLVERKFGGFQLGVHYAQLFGIDAVYSHLFREEAADVIWKAVEYPKSYFESLAQRVEKAGLPRFVLERLVYGACMDDGNVDLGRLAKLTKDMVERFRR